MADKTQNAACTGFIKLPVIFRYIYFFMLTYNIKYLFTQKSANNASCSQFEHPPPAPTKRSLYTTGCAIDFYNKYTFNKNMFTFAPFYILNNT